MSDKRDRIAEPVTAQSDEGARLVSQRRGGFETALPGGAEHREEMDNSGLR